MFDNRFEKKIPIFDFFHSFSNSFLRTFYFTFLLKFSLFFYIFNQVFTHGSPSTYESEAEDFFKEFSPNHSKGVQFLKYLYQLKAETKTDLEQLLDMNEVKNKWDSFELVYLSLKEQQNPAGLLDNDGVVDFSSNQFKIFKSACDSVKKMLENLNLDKPFITFDELNVKKKEDENYKKISTNLDNCMNIEKQVVKNVDKLKNNLNVMKINHGYIDKSITLKIKLAADSKSALIAKLTESNTSGKNDLNLASEEKNLLVSQVKDLKKKLDDVKNKLEEFDIFRVANVLYLKNFKERAKSVSTKADNDAVIKYIE